MLELTGVTERFESTAAVDQYSLEARPSDVTSFPGRDT